MKNISKQIQELGLSDKESDVYLACLELGNGDAITISKKANLPKSTTYDVLSYLSKGGLINTYLKKDKAHYSVSDPEIILEKINRQKSIAEKIMPELRSLHYSGHNKPKVRFYDSYEGILIIQMEMLKEAKEILAIISAQDVKEDYFADFVKERIKKGIPIRAIFRNSKDAQDYKKNDKISLRVSKVVDMQNDFSSVEYMWGNKVAILSLKNDVAVTIIESEEIYKIHRAMFDSIWKYHPETEE
jgi:sugar-specific transcriptional regulator TrmB